MKLKYPFYGSIHWYMLLKYAQELRKLVNFKHKEDTADDSGQEFDTPNRRWLKEIPVAKLALPTSDEKELVSSDSINMELENRVIVPSPQATATYSLPCEVSELKAPTPPGSMDVPIESNVKNIARKMYDSSTCKPYLSTYERGGLLLLVQKMKNNLFSHDIPVSFPPTSDLLTDLEQLLQTAMSEERSSHEPTGVGVLTTKLDWKEATPPRRIRAMKRNSTLKGPGSKRMATTDTSVINDSECEYVDTTLPCSLSQTITNISSPISTSLPAVSDPCTPLPSLFTPPPVSAIGPFHANILPSTLTPDTSSVVPTTSFPKLPTSYFNKSATGQVLLALSPALLEQEFEEIIIRVPNPGLTNISD